MLGCVNLIAVHGISNVKSNEIGRDSANMTLNFLCEPLCLVLLQLYAQGPQVQSKVPHT